ncbi:insulinase family protein [bacterium]|nr:insulinase family protein [bacterium]
MPLIQGQIAKMILSNGLVVLVNSMTNIPKVSMELWYHVGSKDEKTGEKGLAHLVEHMIFKGTQVLSESDINMITHKLSGDTNAFTMHDATGYLYHFPTQHWKEGFALLSDCMRNARFDEQMLNSELKAVIQELKMGKDRHSGFLIDEMLSVMFIDHPYHYPIIGFKQDLWSLKRQTLFDFYHKHYLPNNAVLVVVGDVVPEEVFKEAEKAFGHIKPDLTYQKEEFYHAQDLISKSVTLYRDVQNPMVFMAATLPGAKTKQQYVYDVLSSVLGSGSTSRLVKKLVDELQLVTDLQMFTYEMEDATPIFIYFEPVDVKNIEMIKNIIHQEIDAIVKEGITQKELACAAKKVKIGLLNLLEKAEKRAHLIAQSYIFTGDENFIFNYADYASDDIETEVKELLATYFTPSRMHMGQILPLSEKDKKQWVLLQEISDAEDAKILNGRARQTEVEPARHVNTLAVKDPKNFYFYRPEKFTLSNNVKVFVHNNKELPKIDLVVTLKARGHYDPKDKQGLYAFVSDMLLEGTKNYPGTQLAQELEAYGMDLSIQSGKITLSMLSADFQKGLELLHELLTNALFEKKAIEKVRIRMLSELKSFWNKPRAIAGQLILQTLYKDHPYAQNETGTFESLSAFTQKDLKDFYKSYFSPDGACIALVGDLHTFNVKDELEKYLGRWQGPAVKDIQFPAVKPCSPEVITHHINRDQVTLSFARPSIARAASAAQHPPTCASFSDTLATATQAHRKSPALPCE